MTNDNNSLIDNIFTNNNYAHKYNGILLNDISDHYPILSFFDINLTIFIKNKLNLILKLIELISQL